MNAPRRPPVVLALAILLVMCAPALALDPTLDISQYAHTSWKIRDGFTKGTINAITQTHDGYLWLGTEFGLIRFDGVRTVPWQPPPGRSLPSNNIVSLLTTRDGTLWIGTTKGLASWNGTTLNQHPQLSGLMVQRLLEDHEGTVWASGTSVPFGRLCAIRHDAVQCYGEDGSFGFGVWGLYEDRKGNVWASVSDGLWRWQPGPPRLFSMPGAGDTIQGFDEDVDGTLLITTRSGIRRFIDGRTEPYPLSGDGASSGNRLLHDRDGGLWMTTLNRGVVHVHRGSADSFRQADGLSADAASALFEDEEGNIWVATTDGLDRFRAYPATTLSRKQGLSGTYVSSVLASSDGSVWIGTSDGLKKWDRGRITDVLATGLPARNVESLFQDGQGRVWVSSSGGSGYLQGDRFIPVKGAGNLVRSIDKDTHGNVWMIDQNLGLLKVSTENDSIRTPWSAFGHQDFATTLTADRLRGGLWVGFWDGGVAYLEDGQLREAYDARDGLGEGHVNGLYVAQDGVLWVATEGGLSRLKDGHVATLTSTGGLPCDAVQWVIEDDAHSFWLGLACGLVRLERSELDAWVSDSKRRIRTTLFDSADGVRTHALAGNFNPQAIKSRDGKLWFVPGDGVSVVDPGHLQINTRSPPVRVEQVVVDRTPYDVSSAPRQTLRLPPLARDLQIDYTALSLVAPEKMRFRYKLEGHDSDWQDAGTRRQAFYTNLAPGTYRFRVIASNNSGVWNEEGATLDFAIAPAYYQTTWFLALAAGMVLAVVWAAHRVRLRIVEQHQGEISALNERLMKAQEQERIRIAGELHDGVMQQMLSATMMLGTAKRRIADHSDDAKATIEKVQDKLVQMGTDIRQLSHDLHPPVLQEAGLPKAVQTYCDQFSATSGIPVSCDADEDVRDLSRGAALALFRIVQEALGNAAKHAHAKRITVRLTRSDGMVSLVVADDGVGFDSTRLGTAGGLGLIMMRERASQLNGTFAFESAPGRGTTIRVEIPFR